VLTFLIWYVLSSKAVKSHSTSFLTINSSLVNLSLSYSDCPQFSVKEINDITVKESPKWLKSFLISSGIRSINNIVDIGNYVSTVTQRSPFLIWYVLSSKAVKSHSTSFLTINSSNKVCCLGGIMGGKNCQVDENTKNVIVESANFLGSNKFITC